MNASGTDSSKSCAAASTDTYVYRCRIDAAGWWWVEWQYAYGSSWQAVARVFGERRAEIVRDALSEEANEVV